MGYFPSIWILRENFVIAGGGKVACRKVCDCFLFRVYIRVVSLNGMLGYPLW